MLLDLFVQMKSDGSGVLPSDQHLCDGHVCCLKSVADTVQ